MKYSVHTKAQLVTVGPWMVAVLSPEASAKLPSRGMVMVDAIVQGHELQLPLEPDGNGSHWFHVDGAMEKTTGAHLGDILELKMEPAQTWHDPKLPADLKKALETHREAHDLWQKITPMARWEWIRWIRATNNSETRARRIDVACSKMKSGMRRPCCFNRALCTEPRVSKNGVLMDSQQ